MADREAHKGPLQALVARIDVDRRAAVQVDRMVDVQYRLATRRAPG